MNTPPVSKLESMNRLQKYVTGVFVAIVLTIAALTGFTYYKMLKTYDSLHSENITLVILRETEHTYIHLRDMRKLATTYLITGDSTYPETLPALKQKEQRTMQLLVNAGGTGPQAQRINQLQKNVGTYTQLVEEIMQIPYTGTISADTRLHLTGLHRLQDCINQLVADIENTERRNLKAAETNLKKHEVQTMAIFTATSVTIILFILASFFLVRSGFRRIKADKNKLLESEAAFSTLFYHSPFMYATMANGVITNANHRTLEYTGYKENELVGKAIDELPLLSNEEMRIKLNDQLLKGASLHYVEIPIIDKQGNNKWVAFHAEPVSVKGKTTMFMAGIDITDRKVTEEKLQFLNDVLERKVEERTAELSDYKFALDEAAVVSITDIRGAIRYVNDNFVKLTGYTRNEIIGKNVRILNSGYHPKEYFQSLWQTILSGNVWRGDICNRAKDGSLTWVDTTIVPFVNGTGKPYQFLAIRHDITDRKRAEEEVMELNQNLEHKVEERTAELRDANRQLESFAHSVSHDLRSPLRNIIGFATLLKRSAAECLKPDDHELLRFIITGAEQMNVLIEDMLMFSRMKRQAAQFTEVDMNDEVQVVINEVSKGKHPPVKFICNVLPPARADKAMLHQVWINLIGNAVKYSSKCESPLVEIGYTENNGEVVYYVRDNGAGFDMKDADKLFGVFSRLHTSTEFEGTGVGLSIVKEIIHKHGGRIWAQAAVDKGATFYFTLGRTQAGQTS
jgi:PAS domain S-box-containing protein